MLETKNRIGRIAILSSQQARLAIYNRQATQLCRFFFLTRITCKQGRAHLFSAWAEFPLRAFSSDSFSRPSFLRFPTGPCSWPYTSLHDKYWIGQRSKNLDTFEMRLCNGSDVSFEYKSLFVEPSLPLSPFRIGGHSAKNAATAASLSLPLSDHASVFDPVQSQSQLPFLQFTAIFASRPLPPTVNLVSFYHAVYSQKWSCT